MLDMYISVSVYMLGFWFVRSLLVPDLYSTQNEVDEAWKKIAQYTLDGKLGPSSNINTKFCNSVSLRVFWCSLCWTSFLIPPIQPPPSSFFVVCLFVCLIYSAIDFVVVLACLFLLCFHEQLKNLPADQYQINVFTPDFTNTAEIKVVRQTLKTLGFRQPLIYVPDIL